MTSLQVELNQPAKQVAPQPNQLDQIIAGVKTNQPKGGFIGQRHLANVFDQTNPTAIDITREYAWTPSKVYERQDIPYIQLIEHRNDESLILRQFAYYGSGLKDYFSGIGNPETSKGMLSIYDEIWPDNPTNWIYRFPYFNKVQYELSTPAWSKVDKPGEIINKVASSVSGGLDKLGLKGSSMIAGGIGSLVQAAEGGLDFLAGLNSPFVGVVDRPRIFTEHAEREITIQFPLYNTIDPNDWEKNKNFYYLFASQNLFNKQSFITGLPPVWYRVFVPGQYYSHASSVTNVSIENLGNVRLLNGKDVVPDAYQISITLREMLMPSLNQFQSIVDGSAQNRVTTATKTVTKNNNINTAFEDFKDSGKKIIKQAENKIVNFFNQ